MYYHATPCQRLHDYTIPSSNTIVKFKLLSKFKKFFKKFIYKT